MKFFLVGLILGIIGFQEAKIVELYDITQNNQKQILDLGERSYYIGCQNIVKEVSKDREYCKTNAREWRKELSKNLGIKDTKGTVFENPGE